MVQASISIFFSDNNYIDKKIDQIILEQVPCLRNFMKKWQPFWTNGHHFLCRQKNIMSNRMCTTLVLSSKFCTDIIFSLGNMKLFVSFFHITAVKRCHSQIVLNTNCTPTYLYGFIIPQKDVKGDSYVIIALKTSISTHNFFYYDVR